MVAVVTMGFLPPPSLPFQERGEGRKVESIRIDSCPFDTASLEGRNGKGTNKKKRNECKERKNDLSACDLSERMTALTVGFSFWIVAKLARGRRRGEG
jgi:hypothetical protein